MTERTAGNPQPQSCKSADCWKRLRHARNGRTAGFRQTACGSSFSAHKPGGRQMANWTPDPSFYSSPRMALKAPPETVAYVAAFDPDRKTPDAIAVVDVNPNSGSYSQIISTTAMPNAGDELHHFGWNACSSSLCPNAPHPHMERR